MEPWHIFEVDDGEQHWFAGPDERAVRALAMSEWSVGADMDDGDEVTVKQWKPDSVLKVVQDMAPEDVAASSDWPAGATVEGQAVSATAAVWAEWARSTSDDGRPVFICCSIW